MKKKVAVLLITLAIALPALILGPMIWPASGHVSPTPGQLPFFIFLSIIEALAFGLGVSFLIYGWPLVRKVERTAKQNGWLLYISIAWLLMSWWPHDNMHIHNGDDMAGLLRIEYGFHLTLMIAGFILAYNFFQFIQHYHPGRGK